MNCLDGVRAIAAFGVIVTHVSFQTGTGWGLAERFDYFVAVFFALSAFLLWRRRDAHPARRYYLNRVGRIMPAYLVCVCAVLMLLPDASMVTWTQAVANLTLTQVFWADGLAPGLTHLWSLCVEVAFYLVLPGLAWVMRGLARPLRVTLIIIAAGASLGWAWLPFVADFQPGVAGQVNSQIWPPAYTSWFAVGMLAAEFEGRVGRGLSRAFRVRWAWWLLAAAMVWLGSREFFGPRGLVHPEPDEFARRIAVGAVFAAAVVVPYALAPGSRLLDSPVMQTLGRWSYSVFLWHVAVLGVAFPLTGVNVFSGSAADFAVILAFTVVVTTVVSAASYVLVEEPARRWVRALSTRSLSRTESPE